jgi:hypothetical protein
MPSAALVTGNLSARRANVGSQAARVVDSAVVVPGAKDKVVDSVAVGKVVDPRGKMILTAIRIRSGFKIIDA